MTKAEMPKPWSVWEHDDGERRSVFRIQDGQVMYTLGDQALGTLLGCSLEEWDAWAEHAREVTGEVGE